MRLFTLLTTSLLLLCIAASSFSARQPNTITFKRVSFRTLPGWTKDQHTKALNALKISCKPILTTPNHYKGAFAIPITATQWQPLCKAVRALKKPSNKTAQRFFETYFVPVQVQVKGKTHGLFTGYFLPNIPGSLKKTKHFTAPLYARPSDLITVKLEHFDPALKGQSLNGRVVGGILKPYNLSRDAINTRGLKNRADILAWTTPADRFFLQIQGSGSVTLTNGKRLLLGYNGSNGSRYVSIGNVLIQQKIFTKKMISMQKIRAWMKKNPHNAQALMNKNPSFVFFKILNTRSPLGTQRVPLTAQRSLAIDPYYIPFGTPVWLSTRVPNPKNVRKTLPFNRLLIAQDTGGAIKGGVRGDVYWGAGKNAEIIAGHMKSRGRYWLLIPKTVAKKLTAPA